MVHIVDGVVATNEKSQATVSPSSKRVNVSVKREFPSNCGRNAPRVNIQSVKNGVFLVNEQKPKVCDHNPSQINAKPKEEAVTNVIPAFPDDRVQNALLVHPQPLKDGVVPVNGEPVNGYDQSCLPINAKPKKEAAVSANRTISVIRTFPDRCGRNARSSNVKLKREAAVSANRTLPDGCGRGATPISAKRGNVGVVSVTQTTSNGGRRNAQLIGVEANEGGVSIEDLKVETDNASMDLSFVKKAFMEPSSVQNGGSSLELGNLEVTERSHQNESELLVRPLVPKNMNAQEASFRSEALESIEAVEPLFPPLETQLCDSPKTSSVLNSQRFLASISQSEGNRLPSSSVPFLEDHVLPKSQQSDLIEAVENNKHTKYPPRRRISASRDVAPRRTINSSCSFVEGDSFRDLSLNGEMACAYNSGEEIGRGDTDEQMENTDEVMCANRQQEIVVFTEEIADDVHVKAVEEAEEEIVEHVIVGEFFENVVKQKNLDSISIPSPCGNTVSQLDQKYPSLKEKVDRVSECSTEKLGMESGKVMRERMIVQGVMATKKCPWNLRKVTYKSPSGLKRTTPVSKRKKGIQSKRKKGVHGTHRVDQLQIQESNGLTLPNNRVIIQGLMAAQNCIWNVGKLKASSNFSHGSVERQGNGHEVVGLGDHRSCARRKFEKAEEKSSKKRRNFGNASHGSAHELLLVDEGDCSRHSKEDSGSFTQKSRKMDLILVPFGLRSLADRVDENCDAVFTEDGKSLPVADNMHLNLISPGVDGKYDDNGTGTTGNEDRETMPLVQTSQKMNLNLIPFGLHPSVNEDFGEEAVVTRKTVRETLRLFQGTYRKLLQDAESKSKVGQANGPLRVDLLAAKILKETNKCANIRNKILGHVPGVEVGDEFHYRVELAIVGLHGPYQSGIDHLYNDGKALATSVISSGGYDDVMDSSDVLVYSGQGGIPSKNKKAEDQKLERGNLALKNSYDEGTPVRVVRGYKETKGDDLLDSKSKVITTYVYDGLYVVEKYWQETGSYGTLVFKFQLRRFPGQPELAIKEVKKSRKSKIRDGLCVEDISQGKERRHINAINTVDDENPPPFKYITTMIYPSWYNLTPLEGCQCTDGCSDSEKCACAMKNGGEIPYNYDGAIVEAKPLVYECGPSCKCPPSCHNRVTQHGIKFHLEIFKTESRGWGVRSLNSIPSGSFICEYTGELLDDKEAELRTGNDEYLFDIGQNYSDPVNKDNEPDLARHLSNTNSNITSSMESLEVTGFTIDAADCGSVGRFINHSCSPNCYAQNVLYDHDDKRMPHIMIFAAENIPPLQELAYHYNYELDQVRDINGNIKKKNCYCGSDECTGRMY